MNDTNHFVSDMTGVRFYTPDGKNIQEPIQEHLKNRTLLYEEILMVGDVIKRRNADIFYKIQELHFEIPGIGYFDYAGRLTDSQGNLDENNNNLYFFNQCDIEYKVDLQDIVCREPGKGR